MYKLSWYAASVLLVYVVTCFADKNNTHNSLKIEDKTQNSGTPNISDSRRDMEGYVIGGEFAAIDSFPHSVFLAAYCKPTDETYWICGSSILNQRILLTAAHCMYGCYKNFRIEAVAGTSNIENADVLRQVRRYLIHEQYNPSTDNCDIGLTMLNGDLPLGATIRRVVIRPSFPLPCRGYVAGWGVVTDQRDESNWLKQVEQIIRPVSACSHLKLRPGMMCASSGYSKEYPAVGDSGSALIISGFQQIGIVSFKSKKRALDMIVYTNVSYFYDWIQKESERVYCG